MRRSFAGAIAVAALCASPASADPTFDARSTGLPVATLRGSWSGSTLMLDGAVTRVAPTTFDAVTLLKGPAGPKNRCPSLRAGVAALAAGLPDATMRTQTEYRYRKPGGRWTAWKRAAEEPELLGDGLTETVSGVVFTPPPSCRGPLEYTWRLHGDVIGDVVVRTVTIALAVR